MLHPPLELRLTSEALDVGVPSPFTSRQLLATSRDDTATPWAPPRTLRRVAYVALAAAMVVPLGTATAVGAAAPGQVVITDWQYNGSEFVELTNLGSEAVDMA